MHGIPPTEVITLALYMQQDSLMIWVYFTEMSSRHILTCIPVIMLIITNPLIHLGALFFGMFLLHLPAVDTCIMVVYFHWKMLLVIPKST